MHFSVVTLSGLVALSQVAAAASYCVPGDSCFPSAAELQQFNASVNGNLIKIVPYAQACYRDSYDADVCQMLAENRQNLTFRIKIPGALYYTNWEQNGDQGCYIPVLPADGSAPAPIQGNCTLGDMSSYVVNATSVDDIVTTVKFAAEKKLRFRIKNTGHDYLGRSGGAGTLAVWTRYLNDKHIVEDFSTGCPNAVKQQAISAGPAVTVEELYAFGAQNGIVTTGGICPTVGATGGFIIGGGTGPWAEKVGLGVDNVVQFEVITAKGEKKTINECSDPDLFWAMRGGGGAFAVTTRVYMKTHQEPNAVNYLINQISCDSQESFENATSVLIDLQMSLRDNGEQSGLWTASTKSRGFLIVSIAPQFGVVDESSKGTLEAYAPALNIPGCPATPKTGSMKTWNDVYVNAFYSIFIATVPPGANIINNNRIVTYEQMESEEGRQRIKDFITNLSPEGYFLWQNSVGGATRNVAPDATAAHPVWREAFAFIDVPFGGPVSGVTEAQEQLAKDNIPELNEAFGTAAYYNEGSHLEKDWQEVFWGSNYERLLQIKEEVDPNRVFNCRQCVGSEDGY